MTLARRFNAGERNVKIFHVVSRRLKKGSCKRRYATKAPGSIRCPGVETPG